MMLLNGQLLNAKALSYLTWAAV